MAKKTLAVSLVLLCTLLLDATGCSGSSTSPSTPNPPAAPTISSTDPAPGATGVAANATITVTFSESMDCATVQSSFTVKDPLGQSVGGDVGCSGATATITATLTPLVTYTAAVTIGAKSAAGKALEADHAWSFTAATTPTPLLDRATLKKWVDVGLVNGTGSERVVVLDVGSSTYGTTGHVPGAQLMSPTDATAPVYQNRQEGPAVDVNMVPDGTHMDAIVHKYGIDDHTTVVFTAPSSGTGLMTAARVYWTFRYWGFAKDKLKLLDGLDAGWIGAGYAVNTDVPSITASTYSVKSNASLHDGLRASLTEMMAVASGSVPNSVIVDARSTVAPASYAGDPKSTPGVFGGTTQEPLPADYVVFEGHMKGAQALDYTTLYDGTTFEFKSKSALETAFNAVGLDSTKTNTAYVHCRTGVIASVPFFALDAILDWPVVNYDGSWSQWGQLSADSDNGGRLALDSPWRTDVPELSGLVVYNHSNAVSNWNVELLAQNGSSCSGTLSAAPSTTIVYSPSGCTFTGPQSSLPLASGNQIEEADALYMTQ